jgi:ribose 5-phosphate isomerase B
MAALCCDVVAAQRARQHNDANVLCIRGEDIDTELALKIVKTFLATDFEGGRHLQRVNKIRALDNRQG